MFLDDFFERLLEDSEDFISTWLSNFTSLIFYFNPFRLSLARHWNFARFVFDDSMTIDRNFPRREERGTRWR